MLVSKDAGRARVDACTYFMESLMGVFCYFYKTQAEKTVLVAYRLTFRCRR